MRTLAVTGGIGSGKSYVVRMFSALGVPVYDADSRTKELYDGNAVLLQSL
ncbi:MAG TPA: dephospho-CoA kinase, partial [Candidatus Coprenecus stercoravium]|nr:dephospho-CoA kinase [Candidatus Coprenecus stercoravium]